MWLYGGDRQSSCALFAEMAEHWRGWQGEKVWISAEADFQLSCNSDRLGHVTIKGKLFQQRAAEPWTVSFILMTEAGQLDKLARDVMALLG